MFKGLIIVIAGLGLAACQGEPSAVEPQTQVLADSGIRDGSGLDQSVNLPLDDTIAENALEIVSVTPERVTEGGKVSVRVKVRYQLAGLSSGQITVGFNTQATNEFIAISEPVVIEPGEGELSVETEVVPVLWPVPDSFAVNVMLSEYPHGSSWEPLVSLRQDISVDPYIYQPDISTFSSSVESQQPAFATCYLEPAVNLFCISSTTLK